MYTPVHAYSQRQLKSKLLFIFFLMDTIKQREKQNKEKEIEEFGLYFYNDDDMKMHSVQSEISNIKILSTRNVMTHFFRNV